MFYYVLPITIESAVQYSSDLKSFDYINWWCSIAFENTINWFLKWRWNLLNMFQKKSFEEEYLNNMLILFLIDTSRLYQYSYINIVYIWRSILYFPSLDRAKTATHVYSTRIHCKVSYAFNINFSFKMFLQAVTLQFMCADK